MRNGSLIVPSISFRGFNRSPSLRRSVRLPSPIAAAHPSPQSGIILLLLNSLTTCRFTRPWVENRRHSMQRKHHQIPLFHLFRTTIPSDSLAGKPLPSIDIKHSVTHKRLQLTLPTLYPSKARLPFSMESRARTGSRYPFAPICLSKRKIRVLTSIKLVSMNERGDGDGD